MVSDSLDCYVDQLLTVAEKKTEFSDVIRHWNVPKEFYIHIIIQRNKPTIFSRLVGLALAFPFYTSTHCRNNSNVSNGDVIH